MNNHDVINNQNEDVKEFSHAKWKLRSSFNEVLFRQISAGLITTGCMEKYTGSSRNYVLFVMLFIIGSIRCILNRQPPSALFIYKIPKCMFNNSGDSHVKYTGCSKISFNISEDCKSCHSCRINLYTKKKLIHHLNCIDCSYGVVVTVSL